MRLRPTWLSSLAAIVLSLAAGSTEAEPRVVGPGRGEPRGSDAALRTLFGVPVAVQLIQSDDAADRIRGVTRLGAIGTPEAIDALVEQIEQGAPAARDPRARLEAVRVLAGYTKKDNVRQLLLREATDTSTAEGRGAFTPLGNVIRNSAALALARGGEKKSLSGLVNALLQGGLAAEAATRALRAYPPESLESFLEGRKRLTPALATFLGELGDARAADRLRAMLSEPDPAGQTAASVALARLGDEAALPIAREWLKRSEPRLRRAAAEVLTYLAAPEGPQAVAALLASDATREDGLRLSLLAPSPELLAALTHELPSFAEASRPKVVAAIGRAGGAKAVEALTGMLSKPDLSLAAAHALALMPGPLAREAIERALASEKKADARRLLLRAGVVRALILADAPTGLDASLQALLGAELPADRAVAAFGLVAMRALSTSDAVERACPAGKCDLAVIAAAARGALASRPSDLEAFLPILVRQGGALEGAPSPLAEAAAVALLAHPDGGELSTSTLAAWAEAGGPLAPLAARALPSRDHEAIRARLKRLLEGSDPVVRAHLALGLGRDPEPSAVSLLTSAYRFEDDASVRRAVIRALSRRSEVQRLTTLKLARDLDPDDEVRALGRSALAGRDLDPGLRAPGSLEATRMVAWIALVPNEGKAPAGARAARLQRSDGLAVPAVADPDGALMVPGLPPGGASLLLGPAESGSR